MKQQVGLDFEFYVQAMFERFLTVEQAASMLEGAEKIDTIYMWMPNQEGRAIIYDFP